MDTGRLQAGAPLAIIIGSGDTAFQSVAEVIARSGYVAFVPFAHDPAAGSAVPGPDLAVFQRRGGETEILAAYRQLQGRPALMIVEGDHAVLAAGFGQLPQGPHAPQALAALLASLFRSPAGDPPPALPPPPAPAAGCEDAGPMPAPATRAVTYRAGWPLLAVLVGLIILAGTIIAFAGQPVPPSPATPPGATQAVLAPAASSPGGQTPVPRTTVPRATAVPTLPARSTAPAHVAGSPPTTTAAGPLPHVGQDPRGSQYVVLITLGLLASGAGALILLAGARGFALRRRRR